MITIIQQKYSIINEQSDELKQEAAKDLLVNKSSSHHFGYLHKLLDNFNNPFIYLFFFFYLQFLTNFKKIHLYFDNKDVLYFILN